MGSLIMGIIGFLLLLSPMIIIFIGIYMDDPTVNQSVDDWIRHKRWLISNLFYKGGEG